MLDFRTQSQLVDATAAMMRSAVTATTNSWAASACKGLSLWAELLGAGSPRREPAWQPAVAGQPLGTMLWPSMANWMTAPQLYAWSAWPWLPESVARMGLAWTPFARSWPGPSFSLWAPLADWTAWGGPPMWSGRQAQSPPLPLARPQVEAQAAAPAAFVASYRSAGGHAVAQIAAPARELAGLTATAVLSPMHTVLGAWRAALGA